MSYCIISRQIIHFTGTAAKNTRNAALDDKTVEEAKAEKGYVRSALLVLCSDEEGAVTRIQQVETLAMVDKAIASGKELEGSTFKVAVQPYPLANGNMATTARVIVKPGETVDDQLAVRGFKRPASAAVKAAGALVHEG